MTDRWPFVCPRCRSEVAPADPRLACRACGTSYRLRDGIPILLDSEPGDEKERQAAFFDEHVDDEFELERPAGSPQLYGWLLGEKFRRSITDLSLSQLSALVVCGGSGMDAEFLAGHGARVLSLDISFGAARRARERATRHGVHIDVVVADAEELPFGDRSIDLVYVHDGLHHLDRPLEGLSEMARVARRAVCVTEPAQAAVTRLAVRARLALDEEEAGNRVGRLTLADVRSVLAGHGFRIVNAERYGMYYRHEPGTAARLFSTPGLFHITKALFHGVNALAGRFGNKLVVTAVRT